jgi:hypothetical protein
LVLDMLEACGLMIVSLKVLAINQYA